jgi:hypothetical protein
MDKNVRESDRTTVPEQAANSVHEKLWNDSRPGSALMPDGQQRQWTFAIDLKQSFEELGRNELNKLRMGSKFAEGRLKDLAEETRGKPITFIVQAAFEEDFKLRLERFVIEDGRVIPYDSGKTTPTKGFVAETTDVLKHATEEFPAQKYGFIMLSHGQGNNGLHGNSGKATLNELRSSISEAMHGKQLELIDFTSCDMAQDGMLESMRGLTKNIIASPTPENLATNALVNGEDVNAWLKKAIEHPEVDGYELGKQAIDAVKRVNGEKGNPAVFSLTHFDMTKYPAFADSLSNFGDAMADAMQDRDNRAMLLRLPPSVTNYLMPGAQFMPTATFHKDAFLSQTHDLGSLVKEVSATVESGKVSDPNGTLRQSMTDLSLRLKEIAPNYYGFKLKNYGTTFDYQTKAMGLSVFLPETSVLDTDTGARKSAEPGYLLEFCEGTKLDQKQNDFKHLQEMSVLIAKNLASNPEAQTRMNGVTKQIAEIRTKFGGYRGDEVRDNQEYKPIANNLCNTITDLLSIEPSASEYAGYKSKLDTMRQQAIDGQLNNSVVGWQRFLNTWIGYSNPDALTP